jgi:hypothetical protein
MSGTAIESRLKSPFRRFAHSPFRPFTASPIHRFAHSPKRQ